MCLNKSKEDVGLHPTQKPLKLMNLLIELTTKENQIVLDPFCGSGSTCVSALKLNRNYIGIEYNKDYYNTTLKRIKQQKVELENSLFSTV